MDLGLAGWKVLVTGSTTGIGAAIAELLIAEGANVVTTGRSTAGREIPGAAASVDADLLESGSAERLVRESCEILGGLDGLVLNAGAATKARFDESDDAMIETSLELNVMASSRLVREALPALRDAPGRILFVTALSAREPRPGQLPSNIAKAGQSAMCKTLANELADDGILVNALAPGRIVSAQIDRMLTPDQQAEFAHAYIPLGRFGQPREAAPLAALLVSPANTYITGQIMHVDGGMGRSLF